MIDSKGDQLIRIMLWGGNTIFVIYLLIIAIFNPLVLDDHCFVGYIKESGYWGGVEWIYFNWHGRFSPQFLANLLVGFYQKTSTTFPYILFIIGLIVGSVYAILNQFLPEVKTVLRKPLLLLMSLSFFSVTILNIFDFSTFFWVAASTIHFAGPAFALFGFWLVLNNSQTVLNKVGIIVAFTYVGSSAEHFGAITLAVLLLVNINYFIPGLKWLTFQAEDVMKWRLAIIFCLIAFVIMFVAPGNSIRREYFPESSIVNAFRVSLHTFPQLLKMIMHKGLYLFIIFGIFLWSGSNFRTPKPTSHLIKTVAMIAAGTLVFLYGTTLPIAYAVSSLGPIRSWSYLSFFITAVVAVTGYIIGSWSDIPSLRIKVVTILACLLLLANVVNKLKYLPDTVEYAKMERARIHFFETVKSQPGDTVKIKRMEIPEKNLLLTQELSTDPTFWVNECICDAYGFDFLTVIEE